MWRLLQSMDADALDATLGAWFWKISGKKKALAVDGKTLKGAVHEDGSPVQLLSALLHGEGAFVVQRGIAAKTNEIPEVRNLLQDLDIQGTTVTADALHTQRETAKFLIEEKKAHHLFTAVKGNQKSLRDELTCLDWRNSPLQAETCDTAHGRLELRNIYVATRTALDFPHLGQTFIIIRTTVHEKTGKERTESFFGMTSLSVAQAGPEELLALTRGHWEIENRCHHVRDTTFDEDRSQIRRRNGPRVMATLRNFAMGLLRRAGWENIAEATRQYAARSW
ncbi:ISAs1 family transposase [Acidithiobacillus sp.]|uniref:ISAs1 family transposase n=1 Tax=Acidithiobacillus sp. TaxID=1872118 RepID=UPI003CFE6047